MAKAGKKAYKAPKWKSKPIVKRKAARTSIRKAGEISSRAVEKALGKDHPWSKDAALLPLEIAGLLTDPCGVMYYTNRRDQAAEYRPFFEDELSTLQAKLNMCKHALLGLAGAIETNAAETRAEIGINQEMILEIIGVVKTGRNDLTYWGDLGEYYRENSIAFTDLKMAHDFIYGDGVYWEPLEDLINWAAGDIRSDLRSAINGLSASMREADELLGKINALYASVYRVYEEVVEAIEDLVHWNGNALTLARNFCSEATGVVEYINKREQQFRPLERRSGSGAWTKYWQAYNEPCDKYCNISDPSDCQIWPNMRDEFYDGALRDRMTPRSSWPSYPTYTGCIKVSRGTPYERYDCGEYGKKDVRALVRFITSDLPDQVEELLNYDADALFRESKKTLEAAKRATEKAINLVGGFKDVLDSTGMDATIGTVSTLLCGIGAPTCYSTLSGYRDDAVKGLRSARTSMYDTRRDLTAGITGHTTAKAMWTTPVTPWRVQANVYLATLRNQHDLIQAPWTSSAATVACQTVFPEVPMSCLDKMIPPSCGSIEIYTTPGPKVIDSDMTYRVWDTDSEGGRDSDLLGSGKPILEKETEFGSYGAYGAETAKSGLLGSIKTWQVVAALTIGIGWYTWSKNR